MWVHITADLIVFIRFNLHTTDSVNLTKYIASGIVFFNAVFFRHRNNQKFVYVDRFHNGSIILSARRYPADLPKDSLYIVVARFCHLNKFTVMGVQFLICRSCRNVQQRTAVLFTFFLSPARILYFFRNNVRRMLLAGHHYAGRNQLTSKGSVGSLRKRKVYSFFGYVGVTLNTRTHTTSTRYPVVIVVAFLLFTVK